VEAGAAAAVEAGAAAAVESGAAVASRTGGRGAAEQPASSRLGRARDVEWWSGERRNDERRAE
jgi:hypothetical protein